MIGALGAVALVMAVFFWWLHTAPPWPAPPEGEARPRTRLQYRLDVTRVGRLIGLVNEDRSAWNDVHVEIGEGMESFQCPTLARIDSGQTLRLESPSCRSAAGRMPSRICVVRVAAREGQITSAFEPCLPVD